VRPSGAFPFFHEGPVITPKRFGTIDGIFNLPHGYKDAGGKDLLHGLKK
jgi:hypothetical protein